MLTACTPRPPAVRSEWLGISFSFSKKTRPSLPEAGTTDPINRVLLGSVPEMVIDLISVFEFKAAGWPVVASSCLRTWRAPLPSNVRVHLSPAVSMPETVVESICRTSNTSAEGRRARERPWSFPIDMEQTPLLKTRGPGLRPGPPRELIVPGAWLPINRPRDDPFRTTPRQPRPRPILSADPSTFRCYRPPYPPT